MFKKRKGFKKQTIQDLDCWVPPAGYLYDHFERQVVEVPVYSKSAIKKNQKWEIPPKPENYTSKRRKERAQQKKDPSFFDPELEKFRRQEWYRRINGFWFMNNGTPTYITGLHYFYLCYWKMDTGFPDFRYPDLLYFYFWQYCLEDPNCGGMLCIAQRRQGKTYRASVSQFEVISRTRNVIGGVQSKNKDDAKKFFIHHIVEPFKRLPDYFLPEYDKSQGTSPKNELRFFATSKRGEIEDELAVDALNSLINYGPANEKHYDGWKVKLYVGDEYGKCLKFGTRVRMYDGTVKNVEDIQNGELVMGDDSTPRLVSGVRSGEEEMFEVIPKKGIGFGCNRSHILSMKYCEKNGYNGWKKGEVVNLSIDEYLSLSKTVQNSLVLYMTGFELPEREVTIDPYYLGVWLGDGVSNNCNVACPDIEVRDHISQMCEKIGVNAYSRGNDVCFYVSGDKGKSVKGNLDGVSYEFESIREASKFFGITNFKESSFFKNGEWEINENPNPLLDEMNRYNLIGNKHIPDDFLYNSTENRLQLLAGIIDTDGYAVKSTAGVAGYEITQKNKVLSDQIIDLARGLGFYVHVTIKNATMKRDDGSVYECDVSRITIYGELDRIPCKVERKKANKPSEHIKRRNPLSTGFTVKSVGKGKYYGFSVGDNHLFLLENGIVVHNTEECSIVERHRTVKFCIMEGTNIVGKMIYTTTVEEMAGGRTLEESKKMWEESNPKERDANGRTPTLLYRFFIPAYESYILDQYGMPDIRKAKQALNNMFDTYKEKGDYVGLASEMRKNPMTIEDVFRVSSKAPIFNIIILQDRLSQLQWKREKDLYIRGNLVWVNGERDTRVKFVESPNGRFLMRLLMQNAAQNLHRPINKSKFVIGCDPFEHKSAIKPSDGASYGIKKFDPNDIEFSNSAIFEYAARPSPNVFFEDHIKACVYFGCQILVENNRIGMINYFLDRGYGDFLIWFDGSTNPGIFAGEKSKQMAAEYIDDYVNNYSNKIWFPKLIEDLISFDLSDSTKFDRAMAFGWALVAAGNFMTQQDIDKPIPITDFMRTYKC